jgi:hypothetical protein
MVGGIAASGVFFTLVVPDALVLKVCCSVCDEALQRTAGIGPHHDEYNGEMPGNGMGAARRKGATI